MKASGLSARDDDPGMALARAVVTSLVRAGVREVVVCAGARNAALVAVLARTAALRLWSFPEERSAGFFALGRILALDAPVAVVTTSGTAVAELLPAAIEAFYQARPLVLVTADRPRAFRGSGAPQAIEQPGIFTAYAPTSADVASLEELAAFDAALAPRPWHQPVHLNVCLGEPSAAALAQAEPATAEPRPAPIRPRADAAPLVSFLADTAAGPLVAVVAAVPAREQVAVARFLRRLDCPVLAEATSGLRETPELAGLRLPASEALLARLPVGRVLRIGGVPSSRWWRDLENRPDVAVLSLTPSGFPGLARPSRVADFPDWDTLAVPGKPTDHPAPAVAPAPAEVAPPTALRHHPRSEPALVHALSTLIPRGAVVFLGNSLPIREWNAFATTRPQAHRVFANRGANGIDGCLSTFLGLAADADESWAGVGALTALYDLAALWITPALPPARRRIAVINNGGGRIFSRVAALRGLPDDPRRLMENPHTLEFRAWAELFSWAHARVTTADALAAAARQPEPHLVIEIIPDAAATEACWQHLSRDEDTPHLPFPPAGATS